MVGVKLFSMLAMRPENWRGAGTVSLWSPRRPRSSKSVMAKLRAGELNLEHATSVRGLVQYNMGGRRGRKTATDKQRAANLYVRGMRLGKLARWSWGSMSLCNTNVWTTLRYGIAGLGVWPSTIKLLRTEAASVSNCFPWELLEFDEHAMMLAESVVRLVMEFTRCRRRCDGVQRSTDTELDWLTSVARAALRHRLWDCPAIDNMSYSVVTDTHSLGDMALRDVRQTRLNGQDGLQQEAGSHCSRLPTTVHPCDRARDGVGQLQRLLHRWIWREPYVTC